MKDFICAAGVGLWLIIAMLGFVIHPAGVAYIIGVVALNAIAIPIGFYLGKRIK